MVLALIAAVWLGVFTTLVLFQIYRPAGKQPGWLAALELPSGAIRRSSWQLLLI